MTPRASTLARDYRCPAVPDAPRDVYRGHSTGVKCVAFVGEEGALLASGDSSGDVKLWPTNPSGTPCRAEGIEEDEDTDDCPEEDAAAAAAADADDARERAVAGVSGGGSGVSSSGAGVEAAGGGGEGDAVKRHGRGCTGGGDAALLTLKAGGSKEKVGF